MTMPTTINSKILLSGTAIVAAAVLIVGATFAFFSDTETSVDNTLTAGSLDLKVDSEAHYNGSVCSDVSETDVPNYQWVGGTEWPVGQPCDGTWDLTDLTATNQFFELTDIKPGDEGENTISLHVFDNDAWGRFVIDEVENLDNTCTEPELEAETDCITEGTPGELAQSITFQAWIDDGAIPGFQGEEDQTEGDNIKQENEQLVIQPGTLDPAGETHNIWEGLAAYRAFLDLSNACDVTDSDGNGQTDNDGTPSDDDYLACQGIADDGRMVGSTTYYFGLEWSVPDTIGNEAQTDSLNADLTFEVEQHRNNPTPFTL